VQEEKEPLTHCQFVTIDPCPIYLSTISHKGKLAALKKRLFESTRTSHLVLDCSKMVHTVEGGKRMNIHTI